MEDINTYQMAKTPSKLIHFPRSYSPKTGVMTSSFGPNSADWSSSSYSYTSMKDEMVGILDVLILKEVRYVCGVCNRLHGRDKLS